MPKRKVSCKTKRFEASGQSSEESIEDEELVCKNYNAKSFIAPPLEGLSENECNSDYQGNTNKDASKAYLNSDFGNEMNTMLETLGAEMNKSLMAKRRRMENFVEAAVDSNKNKISQVWNEQNKSRTTVMEGFGKTVHEILNKWDEDFSRQKFQAEKVYDILKQYMITQQQVRVSNLKRLSSLRSAYQCYSKNIQDLESKHSKQIDSMNEEMRTELMLLQKRIIMESQEQEMVNVRKSVQAMLFN